MPNQPPTREVLDQALADSFADCTMSKGERQALRALFADLNHDHETLNYVRNHAFDLVAEEFRRSAEHRNEALQWLEQVVRSVDAAAAPLGATPSAAYFSPGNHCVDQIVGLVRNTRSSIEVCVFTVADDRISDELLAAHRRRVKVRIISDDDKANDHGSDVRRLASQGIPVKIDHSPAHMHHKFAIFDGRTLVNGSFNWTRSASEQNQENIVVLADPSLLAAFAREFAKLWESCVAIR